MLAALWGRLSSYVAAAGVALALIVGAFLYGRADGKTSAAAEQAKANAAAAKKARGVEDEVNKLGRADLDARLSKWLRDGG